MKREITAADKEIEDIFEKAKEIPLVQFNIEGTFSKEVLCLTSNQNIVYYDLESHSLKRIAQVEPHLDENQYKETYSKNLGDKPALTHIKVSKDEKYLIACDKNGDIKILSYIDFSELATESIGSPVIDIELGDNFFITAHENGQILLLKNQVNYEPFYEKVEV